MSDIVLGTIIGGAIALLSGVAGYFLQGYFSIKNTRMRIDHEREKDRETRLIEFRSKYLGPTRDCVLQCCERINDIQDRMLDCTVPFGEMSNDNPHIVTISHDRAVIAEFQDSLKAIGDAYDNLFDSLGELHKWRHQASDSRLVRLIGNTTSLSSDFRKKIEYVNELTHKFEESNEDRLKYDMSQVVDSLFRLRGGLIAVNYRIEELMTGIDLEHSFE